MIWCFDQIKIFGYFFFKFSSTGHNVIVNLLLILLLVTTSTKIKTWLRFIQIEYLSEFFFSKSSILKEHRMKSYKYIFIRVISFKFKWLQYILLGLQNVLQIMYNSVYRGWVIFVNYLTLSISVKKENELSISS
jgi:hypothetical protein